MYELFLEHLVYQEDHWELKKDELEVVLPPIDLMPEPSAFDPIEMKSMQSKFETQSRSISDLSRLKGKHTNKT